MIPYPGPGAIVNLARQKFAAAGYYGTIGFQISDAFHITDPATGATAWNDTMTAAVFVTASPSSNAPEPEWLDSVSVTVDTSDLSPWPPGPGQRDRVGIAQARALDALYAAVML